MDWPGCCRIISGVLFYSLDIYTIGEYYGKWYRYHRHQFWQARLFSFCAGGAVPAVYYYTKGVGQAAQPAGYRIKCSLGGAEYFCTGSLLRWRMPGTPHRYLAHAAGIGAHAGIGPFPGYETARREEITGNQPVH